MKSFSFAPKRPALEIEVESSKYLVAVAPDDYELVRRTGSLYGEVKPLLDRLDSAQQTGDLTLIASVYEVLHDRLKAVFEILLPGKWDALLEASGRRLDQLAHLLAYIVRELATASAEVRLESAAPRAGDGNDF